MRLGPRGPNIIIGGPQCRDGCGSARAAGLEAARKHGNLSGTLEARSLRRAVIRPNVWRASFPEEARVRPDLERAPPAALALFLFAESRARARETLFSPPIFFPFTYTRGSFSPRDGYETLACFGPLECYCPIHEVFMPVISRRDGERAFFRWMPLRRLYYRRRPAGKDLPRVAAG